jgi:hypothetical protein
VEIGSTENGAARIIDSRADSGVLPEGTRWADSGERLGDCTAAGSVEIRGDEASRARETQIFDLVPGPGETGKWGKSSWLGILVAACLAGAGAEAVRARAEEMPREGGGVQESIGSPCTLLAKRVSNEMTGG